MFFRQKRTCTFMLPVKTSSRNDFLMTVLGCTNYKDV